MQCKSCGFLVPQSLKFAIMKNFCPKCGEALFTDKERNHISMIESRVLKQEFSEEMDQETCYDVALFIYNEITSGYGRVLMDEKIKEMVSKKGEGSEGLEDIETSDEDIEKVKAQIREEEAARVALNQRTSAADEDPEDRVKRLKELYKNNPIKKKNKPITRIDS